MKIVRFGTPAATKAISELKRRLSVGAGAVTPAMRRKTVEVFGRALSPIESVRRIVADVRRDGDKAVFRYVRLLDGVRLGAASVRVPQREILAATKKVSAGFLRAARAAIANVGRFQRHILDREPKDLVSWGRRTGVRLVPIRRAGIHVPGFSAVLPSSAIMSIVPAQTAGVEEIAVCTPPRADGTVCPEILACCALTGVKEVYRVGGAQAIAAMAFGTKSIPKVDIIVGPGNMFTTLAKKEVFGEVAVDLLAGPSEVLVLADSSADPAVVASDILGQAEHAPAAAVLVTPSPKLATAVLAEVERQLAALPRRQRTAAVLEEYSLVVVTRTMDDAIAVTNGFAPEHLQITTRNDAAALAKIRSAGTVFVGRWTPIAAGDYYAGPSHTLPTGGTAAFASGLSAWTFLRRMSVVSYDERALAKDAPDIITLAEAEGLAAHAQSVRARFRLSLPLSLSGRGSG